MTEAVLQRKLMDWFLYDNGLRHERVNGITYMTDNKITHETLGNINMEAINTICLKKKTRNELYL